MLYLSRQDYRLVILTTIIWLIGGRELYKIIPIISDEELLERFQHIKPLYNGRRVINYEITELRNCREWDTCPVQFIGFNRSYEAYKKIECYYKGIYPYVQYPTIGEILSQIPEEDLKIASFFEVEKIGENTDFKYNDWNVVLTENKDGCTKVEVILYRNRSQVLD